MCARFTLRAPNEALAELFDALAPPEAYPRYNIAPTQPVIALTSSRAGKEIKVLQWGLVPSWAKDASVGSKLINARAESLSERPAFRNAYRWRRCLIPADGFFEWMDIEHPESERTSDNRDEDQPGLFSQSVLGKITRKPRERARKARKQPFYIGTKGFTPFAFAGLWESWDPEGLGPLETCAIVTTEPNELVRPLHDRMPVILKPEDFSLWLAGPEEALGPLLAPLPAGEMESHPVSSLVNSAMNDSPECVQPLESAPSAAPAS